MQRRVTKINKKIKNHSYKKRFDILRPTALLERKMKIDLILIFEMIKAISNHDRHFFIPNRTGNLLSRQIFKNNAINQLDIFANKFIYL